MNKKYLLKNDVGVLYSCVIDPQKNTDDQWNAVFAIRRGEGFCVECDETKVRIVDYFHAETRGSFAILSVEDTDECANSMLTKLDGHS